MALTASGTLPKFTPEAIPPVGYRGQANKVVYSGGLVGLYTVGANAGFLGDVPATGDNSSLVVVGYSLNTYDNTSGTLGGPQVPYQQALMRLLNGSGGDAVADLNIPCIVYAIDDQTVGLTDGDGTRPIAGIATGVSDAGVQVQVFASQNKMLFDLLHGSAAAPRQPTARGVATANVSDLTAFTVASNDGLTYVEGETVLLPYQTTTAQNGPYIVGAVTAGTAPLVRAPWFDTGSIVGSGFVIHVSAGTLFANTEWKITTTGNITVGTTSFVMYPKSVTQSVVLVAGTATLTNVPILSATKTGIAITRTTANTSTLTVGGYASVGTITAGLSAASITIDATVAAGTINVADVSTLAVTLLNW